MKRLSKLAAILTALVLACAFFGCSNGNSSDDESKDQSITLSDGSYALTITQTSDGMVEKYDIKATASNESWTFKSGSKTQTVDLTKQMNTDELAAFNAMGEDAKKAKTKKEMNLPDDAEISFAGNKVIVKSTLSGAELTEMQENYQLSSIPSDAKIETIKDKTEYKITMSIKGKTIEFYINGCSNGNSSDDESKDQSESKDKSITLSDGSYALTITQTSDGMVEKYDIKATASNESWTFKSGSKTQTVDLTKQMNTDELAAFNAMGEDAKKAKTKKEMNLPDDAEISFAGNKVIVKSTLSGAELTEMQENYQLSSIPSDAKIETIKDKTEYKITMSIKGKTIEFYINGCSNGNSSDDESKDKSITLSDGSYALKITQTSDGMAEEYDIKATASNETWTFKSGSKTQTVDLTKQMNTDELAAFNAMGDDAKKAMAKENLDFPDDAEISFTDNKVIVKSTLSGAELTKMQEKYQLSSIPSDAKIETIKDKTDYKITMSKNKGRTIVFYINKD